MNRNVTPRPIKATGAREAHGRILDPASGALYVHMHRESGLAHRHYVLKPWQVRILAVVLSRPMLLLYLLAIVTWGWLASQAARVPLLQRQVTALTRDAQRLDTLAATLADMRARYAQVQKLLGGPGSVAGASKATATPGAAPASQSPAPAAGAAATAPGRDTAPASRIRPDSTGTKSPGSKAAAPASKPPGSDSSRTRPDSVPSIPGGPRHAP